MPSRGPGLLAARHQRSTRAPSGGAQVLAEAWAERRRPDEFWERGFLEFAPDKADFVLYADFRADPVKHRRRTPSGRIELCCARIAGFEYDDCPGHPAWLETVEWLGAAGTDRYPLHLLSVKPQHRLHSQMDAGAVSRGSRIAGARVTGRMRRAVVLMETGAWYDPVPGSAEALDSHGNPNVLVADRATSRLSQGPNANSCLVQVQKWTGPLPPVRVHAPPELGTQTRAPGTSRVRATRDRRGWRALMTT